MGATVLGHISAVEAYDLLGVRPLMSGCVHDFPSGRMRFVVSTDGRDFGVEATQTTCLSRLGNREAYCLRERELKRDPAGSALANLPLPLNQVVARSAGVTPGNLVIPRGWAYGMPYESLTPLPGGLFACSPEVALFQMAGKRSRGELALLISQLVGSYRVIRPEAKEAYAALPGVHLDAGRTGADGVTAYGLRPLTTVERIAAFVRSMPGAWGSRRIGRALSLTTDNLASPLEAQQYALAFCGRINGSMGIERPQVNRCLEVPSGARGFFGTGTIRPDFFWEKQRVALEVNGQGWHGGESGIAATSRRTKGYEAMDVRCMTITASEIYDLDSFDAAMRQLAAMLGQELPEETRHYLDARVRLRKEILGLGRRS